MSTASFTIPPTHSLLPAPPLPSDAARWALFLDVDGTLLDFADDPLAVQVDTQLLALLHALHRALDGALALVSGRELNDLDRMFSHPRWAAAGLHGLQLRHADGSFRRLNTLPEQQARMHDAVCALAARFDGVHLEDKHEAVALHCRRAPEQLSALHDAALQILEQLPGYELQPGNQVVEFKPAGMDKGRAILELLGRTSFAGRLPVYLGDDLTDEHAFASTNRKRGLSIRVGSREPTLAHFTLPDPAAAKVWLARVLDALTHGATTTHAQLPGGHQHREP
jgi:trehalose 6-phosphate phosphatase